MRTFEEAAAVVETLHNSIEVQDITPETLLEQIGSDPLSARYGEVIGVQVNGWSIETGSQYAVGDFWIGEGPFRTVGDIVEAYGVLNPSYQLIRNW